MPIYFLQPLDPEGARRARWHIALAGIVGLASAGLVTFGIASGAWDPIFLLRGAPSSDVLWVSAWVAALSGSSWAIFLVRRFVEDRVVRTGSRAWRALYDVLGWLSGAALFLGATSLLAALLY
jgi:hypothetical protein